MNIRIIESDGSDLIELSGKLGLRAKMDQADVISTVTEILSEVKNGGDEAICRYSLKFDKVTMKPEQLRVTEDEIDSAMSKLAPDLLEILYKAKANILEFHEAQVTKDIVIDRGDGAYVSMIARPLKTAGVYVPGGTAPLPSSVLMNILPARAAGVPRIVMCTPPRADGSVDPMILAAARIAGASEVYRVGGAQAIAAMAYGTATVPAVDKICGPGNIYVNTAKRLVYGTVDIDMFAGPSEILIIADGTADPSYLAADLLSQAEHDKLASAILLTTDKTLAEQVALQVSLRAPLMPRSKILEASISDFCAIVVIPDLDIAFEFADILAPEHLELCISEPDKAISRISNAGAIFVGNYSPEPLGDYFAGPNHVLPTSGTARFFSPLNTSDFIKKTSIINYTQTALRRCYRDVAAFAEAEQLRCHAQALLVRFEGQGDGSSVLRQMNRPLDTKFWNENTRRLVPYVPGEQPEKPCIKLNTNENPYPPSGKVKEALERFAYERLRLYPDPGSKILKKTISGYYGVETDRIFIGNGSDEVLAMAFQAFFDCGDCGAQVAFPDITYSFYPVYSNLYSIRTKIIPLMEDFTIDLEAFKAFPGGIVIANPNAPTGIAISTEEIRGLVSSNLGRLVIIDEAYVDFGGQSAISLTGEFDNLLVISTVSKSRQLAGLRVGYAIGSPSLIKALECVRDSFNSYTVGTLSQVLATAAFEDGEWFERTRAKIIETRDWFTAELSELGFKTLPSKANFVFTASPDIDAGKLFELLREKGILIRYFDKPRIGGFLRISIGTDEEMRKISDAIKAILKGE
ncbi:MAG: histidinol dehydrogenase [Saccharofermentanales bacterium]